MKLNMFTYKGRGIGKTFTLVYYFNLMIVDTKSTPTVPSKKFLPIVKAKINKRLLRIAHQTASLPAQIAWSLSKLPIIEQNILFPLYQKSLEAHKNKSIYLSENDREIIQELEQNGIYITSLEALELPATSEFLKNARDITLELKNIASLPHNDNHEVHASKAQLMSHSAIFCWGLNERLLDIIEQYLGLPVAYDGASCFLSVPNGKEIGARSWHRDREDRRTIKVCIYLNDVDETSGPFQCLPPALNSKVCDSIKYRYKSVLDQEMEQFFPNPAIKEQISILGAAGTVIFVDTARFYHRGKPPTQNSRTAVFFSYFSRCPWHPFFCQRTPISHKEASLLTQNLSARQQACVNWKQDLPNIVKWIPKSRI
jgi:hypothetical protein